MRNYPFIKGTLAVAVAAGLAGCLQLGGGSDSSGSGGSGSDSGDSSGGGSTGPTTQSVSRVSLSGLVSGVSSSDTAASAAAAQSSNPELANASVRAEVYSKGGDLLTTLATTSDEEGRFQLRLPEYEYTSDDDSGRPARVVLTLEKSGYVVGRKTIRVEDGFESDSDFSLNVKLGKETVATQTIGQGNGLEISSEGAGRLTFGLVRRTDGQIAAVAGEDSARIAAGEQKLLGISIPASYLNTTGASTAAEGDSGDVVTAVTLRSSYVDPNDRDQLQSAPELIACGDAAQGGEGINLEADCGPTVASDGSEEYRLVSSAMAQVKLVDQNGKDLTLVEQEGATAAAEETPEITLLVPQESYDTITEDRDGAVDGLQVPIYINNGQGWVFAGNGTLADINGNLYSNGLPIDFEDDLYVTIEITDGNEWIQWVNLDWPILAASTVTELDYSLTGTLTYQGTGAPYNGPVDISTPEGGYLYAYVNNGQLDFDFTVLDSGNAADDSNWDFWVWNNRTFEYVELTPDGGVPDAGGEINLSTTLANPLTCSASGRILGSNGEGLPNRWVNIEGPGTYQWVGSGQDGAYSANIPCNVDVAFRLEGVDPALTANANGTRAGDEVADSATGTGSYNVELSDFTVENNQPPQIYAVYGPESTLINEPVDFFVYAYDPDGDPITLQVDCGGASCTQDGERFTFSSNLEDDYEWSVTATDSQGATSDTHTGSIRVEGDNKAPRFYDITLNDRPMNCYYGDSGAVCEGRMRAGDNYRLAFFAYDPDGDDLTYSVNGADQPANSYEQAAITGEQTLAVAVSDNVEGNSKNDELTVKITGQANEAPEILFAYADPQTVGSESIDGEAKNDQAINLFVAAEDDVDTDLTAVWSVDGVEQTGNTLQHTIDVGTLGVGQHEIRVKVLDSDSAESNEAVLYVTVGSTNEDGSDLIVEIQ